MHLLMIHYKIKGKVFTLDIVAYRPVRNSLQCFVKVVEFLSAYTVSNGIRGAFYKTSRSETQKQRIGLKLSPKVSSS